MAVDRYDHRCPWRADVLLFLLGLAELDARAERHLLNCALCRGPLEDLVQACEAPAGELDEEWHEDEDLPPDFEARVVAAIVGLDRRPHGPRRTRYCRRGS